MPVINPPFVETKAQRWARRFAGVTDRYGVMAVPPTVTVGTSSSSVNANTAGNVSHRFDNANLLHIGTTLINDGTNRGVGTSTTFADSTKSPGNLPIRTRFISDAPAFEMCFRGSQNTFFGAIIDGQYVARSKLGVLPNSGNPVYVKFDFGADAKTYGLAQIAKSAGGATTYVVGDVLTLVGGTGTAATVQVISVSAGAVTAVEVLTPGAYSVVPTGTIATTGGGGTGCTLTSQVWRTSHTTRKMRKIEIIWHGPSTKIYGVNVDAPSQVLPWPVPADMPKICFIGDSLTWGTYLDYAGAHMGLTIAQKLGLHDKASMNAIGGTGWNVVNTVPTPNGPKWSDALRVADFIAEAADIYVWMGSQNDASGSVTTQVTSTLNQVMAALPNSLHIGTGPVALGSTALSTAIQAGFLAANNQTRIRYVDSVAEAWLSGTGYPPANETGTGNRDFYMASDNTHLGQHGLDWYAEVAASRIADQIISMAG